MSENAIAARIDYKAAMKSLGVSTRVEVDDYFKSLNSAAKPRPNGAFYYKYLASMLRQSRNELGLDLETVCCDLDNSGIEMLHRLEYICSVTDLENYEKYTTKMPRELAISLSILYKFSIHEQTLVVRLWEMANASTNDAIVAFGKKLRESRRNKNIILRNVADMLNVIPPLLADVESGNTFPGIDFLGNLIAVYKLTLEEVEELFADSIYPWEMVVNKILELLKTTDLDPSLELLKHCEEEAVQYEAGEEGQLQLLLQ